MENSFEKFGVGNFKSFQETQEIEIAPITLIFGQNSGGKTSLLQSILSLSQSFYEIENGKYQLSGIKIDAGTFDTALNNKSEKHEIIIETTQPVIDSKRSKRENIFFINTFNPVKYPKVRFYIRNVKEFSTLMISKIEIIFSDYLDGLKLSFSTISPINLAVIAKYMESYDNSNFESALKGRNTYTLDYFSVNDFKEINKRCFNDLCEKFKTLFAEKDKKKWFDKNQSEYTISFGRSIDRRNRTVHSEFFSFIKHAALCSNAFIYPSRRYTGFSINQFTLKEFKSINIAGKKEIFDILRDSSEKIFKLSLGIFDSKNLLPAELSNYIFRDRFIPSNKDFLKSSSQFDTLLGDINLLSNYTISNEIFNKNNIFSKIENIQDNYLKEFINLDIINLPKKDLLLEKFFKIKDFLYSLNSQIFELDKSYREAAKSTIDEAKKIYDYKLVKNRQKLRNFILNTPFNKISNLDIDNFNSLKSYIKEFINIIESKELKNEILEDDEIFPQIEIIINLFKDIKNDHEKKIKRTKDIKVTLAKDYFSENDDDLRFIKYQIIEAITLTYLFRKLSNNIKYFLKNKIIQGFVDIQNPNYSFSSFNFYKNLIWLISSDKKNAITYEDYEIIKDVISPWANDEYPFLSSEGLESFSKNRLLINKINNYIIPSAISTLQIISPRFNTELVHLGPSRPGAKRFYTVEDIDNASPDDVAFFLKIQKYKNKEDDFSIKILNNYLSSLDIVEQIKRDKSKDSRYDFESIIVKRGEKSKPVNLADTGYGLSQLFPIIINAVNKSSNTILIQQPETHLHPRLQAEVGSILVDSLIGKFDRRVSFNKKSWIVETHSEIMLLRILKRIRKGEFKSENLRVYYVDQNKDKGSIIKRMYVSDEGELITQWPKGFFSNDIDEMFDI